VRPRPARGPGAKSIAAKLEPTGATMTPADTIDFAREAIWVLLEIAAPAMLTALVVGLGIGLLQALTQIQEMTLVFVPKIIAIFVVLLIALPFAGQAMYGLMTNIVSRIAAY
jgi:flagellar biosynthetic protein FliQ